LKHAMGRVLRSQHALLAACILASLMFFQPADAEDETLCNDGIFCNGISFMTTSGNCTKVLDPCDDLDDTTTDSCNEAKKRCYHEAIDNNVSTCITDCVSDCTGKACGEDGCNGFCGQCAEGWGCQNYTCVAGAQEGTCDKPFNLGSNPIGQAKYYVKFGECVENATLSRPSDKDACEAVTDLSNSTECSAVVRDCASAMSDSCPAGCTDPGTEGEMCSGNSTAPACTYNQLDRITVVTQGDTSNSVHKMTPSCNYLTAAPERAYSFEVPAAMVANGAYVGYDIRVQGYDTVLEVMYGNCSTKNSIGCSDDATPPGSLGSKVSGKMTQPGTYYVLVDGFSSKDYGEFTLTAIFVKGCQPQCDGNFCGDDNCGGKCGACPALGDGTARECRANNRCYNTTCSPLCANRTCGEDGCGGSCGTCPTGQDCLGESIDPDLGGGADEVEARRGDGGAPTSECKVYPKCIHNNPTCDPGCGADEFCGSDCTCYANATSMPDVVVVEEYLIDSIHLHDVFFPNTSCSLREGCVGAPGTHSQNVPSIVTLYSKYTKDNDFEFLCVTGMRRLLRFTSAALNQGTGDFSPPAPKTRPDLFAFGACHQHYHYRSFAQYHLYDENGP
jgi:hypothetical protein